MNTTLYENARIVTDGHARSTADALAVRGERIIAVGGGSECRDAAGPGAKRVDLGGAVVIPGLVDSHLHAAQFARGREAVDLRRARSLDDALAAIASHAAELPDGAWVSGGRWDYHRWLVPTLPTRDQLDTVTAGHPAALPSIDGHTTWVNSAALAAGGIDSGTADPAGGVIERDAAGRPTGILRETADDLVRDLAGEGSAADLAAQLRRAMTVLLSHGLTGFHDIDGMDAWTAFEAMHADGTLPMRVHKLLPKSWLGEAIDRGWSTGDGDRWLSVGAVKLFADGALGSHSCLMDRPYGRPAGVGLAVTPAAELRDLVRQASSAGIAVATHAIGDAANRAVLAAYARATAPAAVGRLRMRIEHAQFVAADDVPLFARLGVIASMQPVHCTSDIDLNETVLGPDPAAGPRLVRYGWRTLRDAGARLAFGSDAPVEDPNPWHGIHAAVTRTRRDGTPPGGWMPPERLGLTDAIAGYTTGAAYASGEEHLKGALAAGMLADFAVLGRDPFLLEDLADMPVTATVVGGTIRWEA